MGAAEKVPPPAPSLLPLSYLFLLRLKRGLEDIPQLRQLFPLPVLTLFNLREKEEDEKEEHQQTENYLIKTLVDVRKCERHSNHSQVRRQLLHRGSEVLHCLQAVLEETGKSSRTSIMLRSKVKCQVGQRCGRRRCVLALGVKILDEILQEVHAFLDFDLIDLEQVLEREWKS